MIIPTSERFDRFAEFADGVEQNLAASFLEGKVDPGKTRVVADVDYLHDGGVARQGFAELGWAMSSTGVHSTYVLGTHLREVANELGK